MYNNVLQGTGICLQIHVASRIIDKYIDGLITANNHRQTHNVFLRRVRLATASHRQIGRRIGTSLIEKVQWLPNVISTSPRHARNTLTIFKYTGKQTYIEIGYLRDSINLMIHINFYQAYYTIQQCHFKTKKRWVSDQNSLQYITSIYVKGRLLMYNNTRQGSGIFYRYNAASRVYWQNTYGGIILLQTTDGQTYNILDHGEYA